MFPVGFPLIERVLYFAVRVSVFVRVWMQVLASTHARAFHKVSSRKRECFQASWVKKCGTRSSAQHDPLNYLARVLGKPRAAAQQSE
jgi:hypothetical protein